MKPKNLFCIGKDYGEKSFLQNFQYITIKLESIAKEFIEFCYACLILKIHYFCEVAT